MSKHNFIESKSHGSEWNVIIYCTWCGVAVWYFNNIQESKDLNKLNAATPCKASTLMPKENTHADQQ